MYSVKRCSKNVLAVVMHVHKNEQTILTYEQVGSEDVIRLFEKHELPDWNRIARSIQSIYVERQHIKLERRN